MEWDEMKNLWAAMNQKLEQQELINDKIIMEITRTKFRNRFSTVQMIESLASVVCVIMAGYLLFNFHKLDSVYLNLMGGFVAFFLLAMPVMVLSSIARLKRFDLSKSSFKDTLIRYSREKRRFMLVQTANTVISFLVALMVLPLATKLLKGEDFFAGNHSLVLYVYLSVFFIALFFFARWGLKCYRRITDGAGDLLNELNE